MKYFVYLVLLFSIFLPFSNINAQMGIKSGDIEIQTSPDNPGPNQIVDVSLTSYVIDIDSAKISWSMDGVIKKSGRGEKDFSFKTKNYGETTVIKAKIEDSQGGVIVKTLNVRPQDVDIIWESSGYTHPFYKGKSVFSHQDKITFIAIPHMMNKGIEINPKNLVYKWHNGDSVIESSSGYGKNTYTMTGSVISRDLDISVDVSDLSGNLTTYGSVNVKPSDPTVIMYEQSPIYGIQFQKALSGTIDLIEKEISIVGIPYFYNVNDPSSKKIDYKWSVNGSTIGQGAGDYIKVFRKKEGVSGTSKISLSIENVDEFLQAGKSNFNITFKDNNQN